MSEPIITQAELDELRAGVGKREYTWAATSCPHLMVDTGGLNTVVYCNGCKAIVQDNRDSRLTRILDLIAEQQEALADILDHITIIEDSPSAMGTDDINQLTDAEEKARAALALVKD